MKQSKKWLQVLILMTLVVFLAACGNQNEPLSANSSNLWDRFVIFNLSQFLIWLSNLFGGSYAMGIIVFTIIIRLLLIPINKMQYKAQRDMQEIQPELDKLKEKFPNRDRESMRLLQEAQQELMADRGVNQFAGCLPVVIQLPVMLSLYQAIVRTEALRQGHFFWTNLGQPDPFFILPILAAGLTLANSYFTMKANQNQHAQLKMMMYAMPLMILLISLTLPSAVTLYWVISNAITLAQTFIFNNPYKIIAERQAKLQAEKDRERALKKALKRAKK